MVSIAKKRFLIKYSIIFFYERGNVKCINFLKKKNDWQMFLRFLGYWRYCNSSTIITKNDITKKDRTVINCILYNMKYL